MNDDLDPLRELRPDRVRPDDPGDPTVLSREKERLMSTIDDTHTVTEFVMPDIYPRLAYRDERAAARVPRACVPVHRDPRGAHGVRGARARVAAHR